MKKIILTALTVLMIFGLIGCSGVLHDKAALDISGFAVVGPNGSWDGSQKLTKVSDNEFTFEFVANGETEQVSLQLVPGSWDTRYCGDLGGGKQAEVEADNKESSATMVYYEGGDPKHMLMKGLKAGGKYKITFKVNEANDIVVSVASVYVPVFYVLKNNEGLIKLEYTGTYAYKFTATDVTENICLWSDEKYYEGKVTFNAETATPVALTAKKEAKYIQVSGLEADGDYLATISVGDDGVVSIKVEAFMSPYFMVGATTYGSGQGVKVGENDYFVRFELTDEDGIYTYEFKYETSMSDNWGSDKDKNGICFKIVKGAGWSNTVFGSAELKSDYVESKGGDNASANNLVDGKTYIITLKEADGKFSAKIAEKQ